LIYSRSFFEKVIILANSLLPTLPGKGCAIRRPGYALKS